MKKATQSSESASTVAQELGISAATLYQWISASKSESAGGLSFEEREELANLRRENKRLRLEREILKKASILFAKGDS